MHCAVAPQLVSDQPPRFASLTLQEFAKEPLGCTAIATRLDEDFDDVPGLIDGPPEIVPLTPDSHKELVQVPDVAQATLSPGEVSSAHRTELPTPLPDCLAGNDDPAFGEEIFDIWEAQTEAVVQPDSVADDLGWVSVSTVAGHIGFHRASLAR